MAQNPAEPALRPKTLSRTVFRVCAGICGAVFLFLAGVTNYCPLKFLFADRWVLTGRATVFFRLPGMGEYEFYHLPLEWVLAGIGLILLAFGFSSPGFRRAVSGLFIKNKARVPFLLTLGFFLYTLYPWNFVNARQHETGAQIMLYLGFAGAGFVLLLAALYPGLHFFDAPVSRLVEWVLHLPRRWFLLLSAGSVFLVANTVSLFVFEHIPHIQDSISQLFQARIFASGRIHLPSPPFPDFFDYTHIINNGRWYSQYPWLHSFLLMFFVLLGVPWLLNPLAGALFLIPLYYLGREIYDETTARLGTLLGALSPFILFMSSEYMNHSSALVFATLFLLFYFRVLSGRRPCLFAPLAGLALGAVANIRPYTAVALAVPFAVYGLLHTFTRNRRLFFPFLLMALCTAATAGLVLIYNYLANGHPLLFGYVVKWGPGHEVGFGHSAWGPPHTPFKGFLIFGNNFNLINKFLFESPWPALALVLLPFALGTRNRNDWLLVCGFLALPVAYFFYWFHNVCFGPRFLYESSGCLLLLAARGLRAFPQIFREPLFFPDAPAASRRFLARAGVLTLGYLAGIALPPLIRTYHTYGGVSAAVHRTVRRAGLKNALVFCDHFGAGFSYNQLDLKGAVVYCRDYGYLNAALTLSYPDRRYYFAKHDTLMELRDIKYENSLLKQTLDDFRRTLADTARLAGYRTILWPFADIPPGIAPEKVLDYRTLSREIFQGRRTIHDYTPILACWLFEDPREHLALFSTMDDAENSITAGLRFTLLRITENNLGAVYDIRE